MSEKNESIFTASQDPYDKMRDALKKAIIEEGGMGLFNVMHPDDTDDERVLGYVLAVRDIQEGLSLNIQNSIDRVRRRYHHIIRRTAHRPDTNQIRPRYRSLRHKHRM